MNLSAKYYSTNHFSHIHDALQYLMMGAGEGRNILSNISMTTKPFQAKMDFDVFSRKPKPRRQGLWSRM